MRSVTRPTSPRSSIEACQASRARRTSHLSASSAGLVQGGSGAGAAPRRLWRTMNAAPGAAMSRQTVGRGCCCRQPAAAGATGSASCAAQRAAQLRAALRISAGQHSWRPTALRSGAELLTAQRTKRWELRLVLVHSATAIAASRNFPLNSPTHNLLQPAQTHPTLGEAQRVTRQRLW